jgi:hypothetical protein
MSIEAMKQALSALAVIRASNNTDDFQTVATNARDALYQAIVETEKQEPVTLEEVYETIIQWDEAGGKRSRRELARRIVDLYTAPPKQKNWGDANPPVNPGTFDKGVMSERQRIVNMLMIQHAAAKGGHNYWQVAVNLIQSDVVSEP